VEYASLDRINRADLVEFHRRYFFPQNVTMALAGDFDAAHMKAQAEAIFEDWKATQSPVPAFPDVAKAAAPGKFLAVKKDIARAYFAVGQVACDPLDKDYPALQIVGGILAGGPQARLNMQLHGRVEGLTASGMAGLPALFRVTGTVPDPFFTPKALRTVYEQLNRIQTEQVPEQELKIAKAAALTGMVFAYSSGMSILPQLAEYQYFNFPGDYTQQFQKALESVTAADVLRVARDRLDLAKMTTIVVGNPTAFESPLESLGGAVSAIDLTIPPPKPEAVAGDAASERRARELLARAQQALGGADKLAAVTDYMQEIAYQFDASAGGAQATMTERWIAPGYLRQDTDTANSRISVYCDGKIGWVVAGRTSAALTGVQLKQVQNDLFRVTFPLLLSDRDSARKINALDDQTVEISDAGGHIVKLVFDPATGLPKNALYNASTANGTVAVMETYADYRETNGVKVPYQTEIDLAGKKFQDVTVKSFRMNTGLKIADLEKRP
jgi:zinc protease